jgi:Na+-translocating ferredoxin:NAD+ oxidoreductase RnfE subunit
MASGRLAYALTAGLALVFVYLFSALCLSAGRPLISDNIRGAVAVILSSFFASLFLLVLSLVSPLFAQESSFFVLLTPIVFVASGIADRCARDPFSDGLLRALIEAVLVLALLLAFSLVREPIGYGSLSLPGADGLSVVLGSDKVPVFAVRAAAVTVGGFILLAYVVVAFRKVRAVMVEDSSEKEEA